MYQGLEEEVEFLRELIQASPQVIYVYNQLSNRLEFASGNLHAILGFSIEELQALPNALWDVVHPDDLPLVNAHVQKMRKVEDGTPVSSTIRLRHKGGHYIWVNTVDRFFKRQADGLVSKTIGFASDVTSIIESKNALESSSSADLFLLKSSKILSDVSSSHKETLQKLSEYVSAHFEAVCHISIVALGDNVVKSIALHHSNPSIRESFDNIFAQEIIKVGEGVVANVIGSGFENFELQASEATKVRVRSMDPLITPESLICCPLLGGHRILGAVTMIRLENQPIFTETDLVQIRKLTENAALFLDNALIRENQKIELELRRITQIELHYSNNVNNFLLNISRILSNFQVDTHETLQLVTQTVALHFNAFCVVYLNDIEQNTVIPKTYFHKDVKVRDALKRAFSENELENGLNAAQYVIRKSEPFIVKEVTEFKPKVGTIDSHLSPKSYGFWPLKGKQAVGALCLCRPSSEAVFTDYELEMAENLANYMSIFLENILLNGRQKLEIERRKQAEERLEKSEANLRSILNAVPINISRISKDLKYTFLNDAFSRIGFNPEEYVGQHIQSIIGIDAVDRLLPKFETVLQGNTLNYEEHLYMTNGEDRFFNVFMAPDIQEEGDIVGFYVCTVDKTERVETERELAISGERYRSLLLNSGDAFCFHRITGEILDVNVFATTLLGYSREELLSMRINQIDFNWNTPLYFYRLEKVISDTPITIDTLVYRKDGTPIPVEVRFVKRIEHGQVMVQALVRNRTDKYEQEQLLRKSEERLRILIDNVDDIIITLDWEGTILSINKPQQGHTLEETIGSNIYVGMEEDVKERMKKCMLVAKETGQAFELLLRHRGPDGTIEWYLTHYCPVECGQMLVCVSRIITHLKESELQVMNGMTLGQEQERKRLGAELHDGVGQILSAISLELSQMGKSLSSIEETQSQLAELSNRVTEAIHEVRNISHDLMPGLLESFGLEEAVREVCRNMQERTGIKIQFNPIDLQPKYLESIETHIYRILQELILNGVKHAHCSKMYVNLIDDDDVISLTVEDDGIGFDASKSSNGIGLKNIRSRVSILRGTLSVETSNTSGTLIHIELPKF